MRMASYDFRKYGNDFRKNGNKKKRGVTLALCSSVVKDFFTTGMVENVGYALGAVACSLAYQAI